MERSIASGRWLPRDRSRKHSPAWRLSGRTQSRIRSPTLSPDMHNERLVRHFLRQFVENEWSPDADRHQVLAIAAAALVTIPLFATMFIGLKYLIRPLQA